MNVAATRKAPSRARPVVVQAAGLGQVARGREILKDVGFVLRQGELVAVLGPSGAGKSTLIELVAGAARPASGELLVHGQPLDAAPGRVGYVPQADVVHDALTLREALETTARLRAPALAASPVALEARVARVAARLGLAGRLDVRAGRLSGGERRRASLAVELLASPAVLVVDEVTSGLDAAAERRVVETLRQVADDGTPVLAITHTLGCLALVDRVLVLHGGRLVFDGPPAAACAHVGVARPDELYAALQARSPEEWAATWRTAAVKGPVLGQVAAVAPAPRLSLPTGLFQLAPLAARQARLQAREGWSLLLLLAQGPIIAGLIAFAYDATSRAGRIEVGFKLALAAIWLGCVGACQELVKERAVYRHERRAGLSVAAYLASKVQALLVLAALQAATLTATACALEPLGAPPLRLGLALFGGALAGGALGLAISALVKTRTAAVGLTPLALVPQVLLVGTLEPLRGLAAAAGRLMPAHWTNEAVQAVLRGELGGAREPAALGLFVVLFLVLTGGLVLARDVVDTGARA